jgi:isopentenyl-diphosphate delta-isomerase
MSELFDVIDPQTHETIRQELRSVVHATGLLHRAVYCWIFSREGSLLLQRRSASKRIGRLQWDLSLAEHLTPGESYRKAVVRGLREELGLDIASVAEGGEDTGAGKLVEQTAVHRRELHGEDSEGKEFHDVELVQSFFLRSALGQEQLAGLLSFDDGEVSEVRFVDPKALKVMFDECSEAYTPWLRAEAACLGLTG